ncbi:stage II sporulation protein [Leptolyngbya sp. BL0902]|uniref:SpoIID/LytB domain-containing protein n=1 Tax=Leptolyngbya sp. BL0902 TaxID=1115757 RepID=UPI001936055A|nr:SpoIID/LytB domain-containing protein [Leptolyngbya sp. BL0902]QQE65010.1 stage II sporulation protein [Leptolyngbya sp. BL0902]
MKRFWMTGRFQPHQPTLRQWPLKSVRSLPIKIPNLGAFQIPAWRAVQASRRLQILGGLALAGLVITPLSLASVHRRGAPSAPAMVQSSLWEATGLVRQSVVDLHRIQRLAMQAGMATPNLDAPDAASTVEEDAALASAPSAPAAPSAPQTSTVVSAASSRTVPQPPPAPSPAINVAFDPAKTIDTNLEMRVAVARNVSSLEVATSTDGYLMDLNGQGFCNLPAQRSVVIRPQGGGLGYGGCQLTGTIWLEPGEGGYVYVGNAWFKGRVLLMASGSTLTAVNFVLMHDYLSSVVGSEMYVTWPLEALKAQAVAARSYALVHHVRHANRAYDLDNTQRYQAYLGIAKETNTTQAAVAATSGEFISHNGGIVESLYAASDAIVQSAHRGRGMSQRGAMELARQGFRYTEILSNYYPNTSLSRLVVQ